MDKNKNWMPLWLVTYIFVICQVVFSIIHCKYSWFLVDNGYEYCLYTHITLQGFISLPWVSYFTYLGNRYFATIPRVFYVLVFAPILEFVIGRFSMETIYCSGIFTFNGQMQYIYIGVDDLLYVALAIFVAYEVFGMWRRR